MRRRTATTGGVTAVPLVVLFALNLVDEFDRVAFGVLSPEIRDTFGLSDSGIVAVGSLAGVTALLAALPIGVLADRVRRVRLAGVGAAAWGGFTILTALAPAVWVRAGARRERRPGRSTGRRRREAHVLPRSTPGAVRYPHPAPTVDRPARRRHRADHAAAADQPVLRAGLRLRPHRARRRHLPVRRRDRAGPCPGRGWPPAPWRPGGPSCSRPTTAWPPPASASPCWGWSCRRGRRCRRSAICWPASARAPTSPTTSAWWPWSAQRACRAQAYAWAILWLGVGAITAPLLAGIGESSGYRVAIGVLAVTLLAGGAAATTARSAVRGDADAARAALTSHVEPPNVPVVP